MAKMVVDSEQKVVPVIMNGTLLIHKELPPMVVMATGIEVGDEFPGVSLEDGHYGEQWIATEFNIFDGKLTLEQ